MKTEDRRQKIEMGGQRSAVSSRNSEGSRNKIIFCFLLTFVFCLVSCSIPNLESPDCDTARNSVREFYSFDYSNDTKFNQANLKLREKFLTPELFQMLSQKPDSPVDYFTNSEQPPKAFRVGECKVVERGKKTLLGIVLFWRENEVNRQKEVEVEAVRESNEWLVNKVEPK